MRKFTLTLAVAAAMGWMSAATAWAGDKFVPKAYSYTNVGSSSQSTINIPMTDLFDYPDGMAATANLDEAGVKVEFEFANEAVVGLYRYEYYNYGQMQELYLMRKGNFAVGKGDVTVKLTYKDETVENKLDITLVPFMAQDDEYTTDLGKAIAMPVLSNDAFMRYNDKNQAKIEIVQAPANGQASIIDAGESKQDSILYTPNADLPNYSYDELKYKITMGEDSSVATVKINIHKNAFAARVIDFLPAPGQFTNQLSKSNSAENTLGEKGGTISLGSFGGYVIYGFDQPIMNNPKNPYGVDFTVRGNSFVANIYGVWTEPGAVQVCQDLNGNGVPDPDEPWYELAGSDYWLSTTKRNARMTYYNPNYTKRYTVPWTLTYTGKDGQQQMEAGAVLTNQFHQQSYYPDPFDFGCNRDSLTFEGSIIRSSLDMSAPSYIEFYRAPAFGYCDNRGFDKSSLTIAHNPYYNDENGNAADGFDISWAVDKDGNHVDLDHVDFVKVYCAGSANAGWLGEWSTEVLGVGITTPDPNYEPKDYYLNYIGITQLQVVRGQECQFEGFLFKNGRPQSEGEQKWWLSTDSVGTIDNTGLFKATGKTGKTRIYFTQREDVPTDSIDIDVVDLTSVLIDLEGNASKVSNDSTKMIAGETIYINVQCTDSRDGQLNGTGRNRYIYDPIDWTNSDPEVGTINNGSFRALKAGRTMLHAYAHSNHELSDSILVIVEDAPEIQVVNDPLRIAYYEPEGSKTSAELFTAGNNSIIYLDSVRGTTKYKYGLDKNTLTYKFRNKRYVADTLTFNVTHYGQKKEVKMNVVYAPDTRASNPLLLYSDNNVVKSYDIRYSTQPVKALISDLAADSIKALVADGGFTYVATKDSLFRYNTGEAHCTNKCLVAENGIADKMLVARNLVLLASHTPAGISKLNIYYKTDLEPVTSFTLSKNVKDMAVTGDKLYVATQKGDKSSMAIFDLKNFIMEREVSLGQKGMGIETLLAKGDRVYGVSPYEPETEKSASLLVFNTTNNTSTATETDGIQAYFEGVPAAVKPMIGDSIYLANYNGFTAFDTQSGQMRDGITMTAGSRVYPTEAVHDSTTERTYVVYADENARNYQAAVYNGKEFDKECDVYNLGTAPSNLTTQPALEDNEAPKPSTRFSMSPNNYCYEMATTPSQHTIWKSNNFTDHEGDFDIYLRGLEKYPWITQLDNLEGGDIRIQALYRGTVDKDTVINFQVEAIDRAGASTTTNVAYTIKAQIVKPTVENAIADTTILVNADTVRISLKNVFGYKGSTWGTERTTSVSANDNPELISDSIDSQNDELVLVPAAGKVGMANLTVRYTVSKEEYGQKYAETSFRVIVEDPTKVNGIASTSLRVLTNPFTDHIEVNVPEDGTASLYDTAGQMLMQASVKAGANSIATGSLPTGTYLLQFKGETVKVIRK